MNATNLPPERKSSSSWIVGVLATLWITAALGGLYLTWNYENRAGAPATAGPQWPAETKLIAATDRPTLVFIAHPQCTCTRASIGELAEALGRATVQPKTYVVFLKPSSMPDGWEKTDLWTSAEALPNTTIVRDDDGLEAERFGTITSGQTLLYDSRGSLLFSGGITGARAHPGDNAGRAAIVDLINQASTTTASTKVFGCSLFSAAKS